MPQKLPVRETELLTRFSRAPGREPGGCALPLRSRVGAPAPRLPARACRPMPHQHPASGSAGQRDGAGGSSGAPSDTCRLWGRLGPQWASVCGRRLDSIRSELPSRARETPDIEADGEGMADTLARSAPGTPAMPCTARSEPVCTHGANRARAAHHDVLSGGPAQGVPRALGQGLRSQPPMHTGSCPPRPLLRQLLSLRGSVGMQCPRGPPLAPTETSQPESREALLSGRVSQLRVPGILSGALTSFSEVRRSMGKPVWRPGCNCVHHTLPGLRPSRHAPAGRRCPGYARSRLRQSWTPGTVDACPAGPLLVVRGGGGLRQSALHPLPAYTLTPTGQRLVGWGGHAGPQPGATAWAVRSECREGQRARGMASGGHPPLPTSSLTSPGSGCEPGAPSCA